MILRQSKGELTIGIGVSTHARVATLDAYARQRLMVFIHNLALDYLSCLLCIRASYLLTTGCVFSFFITGSRFLVRSIFGHNNKLVAHHLIRKGTIGYHSLHGTLRIDSRQMSTHRVALDILVGELHSHTTLLADLLQGCWQRSVLERDTEFLAQTLCGNTQHKGQEHEQCHQFSLLFSLFHTH